VSAGNWASPCGFGAGKVSFVRFHWFAAGAERSACENYAVGLFMITSVDGSVSHELCPRCREAFTLCGETVPPFHGVTTSALPAVAR
jgi:hypothetical protein